MAVSHSAESARRSVGPPPALRRAGSLARDRAEVVIGAALVLATFAFPHRAPLGIDLQGVVGGSFLALQAVGFVLVFRSNRIINFAQIQVGLVAATFFQGIVSLATPVWLVNKVCPACVAFQVNSVLGGHALFHLSPLVAVVNYLIALVVAVLVGAGLSLAIHYGVVRRFREAPRLVLTVATLFVAEVLVRFSFYIPGLLANADEKQSLARAQVQGLLPAYPPFPAHFRVSSVLFNGADVLTVVAAAAAIVGVIVYLRRSGTGTTIRAAAEDGARVETLGVNASAMTARVWLLAGMLSTLAGVLTAMGGQVAGSAFDAAFLVRILAIALLARLSSLPVAAVVAVAFGILDAAAGYSFSTTAGVDGAMVLVIIATLVLQRQGRSRADVEAASGWLAAREIRPIPAELRSLPVVRTYRRSGALVGAVILVGLPWVFSTGQTLVASTYLIYGMVGLSLLVLTGWAGQISLGQLAFAAAGAYIVAVLPVSPFISLPLGALAGAALAVVVGLPALRLRGLNLAILTLALSLAVTSVVLNPAYLGAALPATLARPRFLGLNLGDARSFYYAMVVLLAGIVVLVAGLRRGRFGRALISGRDNERAAQAFGVSLLRTRLAAFAVSGGLAAFAGGLLALAQFGVRPESFSPAESVTLFLMAVIGGFGAISAPLIGTLYLAVAALSSSNPATAVLATGVGGLFVVLISPGGLGALAFRLRDAALRRVAERARIVVPSLVADVGKWATRRERAALAPKARPGGGTAFVPTRYGLDGQWALTDIELEDRAPDEVTFGSQADNGSSLVETGRG